MGVDAEEVRDALADEGSRAELTEQFEQSQRQGVSGVPTFACDGYGARGAVPPEQLERLVEGTRSDSQP